ncbi:hypothetical protein BH11MYX3_BH11MYX3_27070 [soil metagenome]
MNNPNTLQIIDLLSLQTVIGGQGETPPQPGSDDQPQGRSWGQVARDYGAACVMGAGQSLVYGGMPRNVKSAAIGAAAGCAMGMGMKAVEDVSGALSGS